MCIQVLVKTRFLRTSDKNYTAPKAIVDNFFEVIVKALRNKHRCNWNRSLNNVNNNSGHGHDLQPILFASPFRFYNNPRFSLTSV